MADRQDHGVGGDLIAARQADGPQPVPVQPQPRRLRIEPVLHPQRFQVQAQGGQHPGQPVRTDVGPGFDGDLVRGAEADQIPQHPIHRLAILAAGVQLAVGIGARPALAKAVVGFRVQLAPGQLGQIVAARLHRLASFQDRGGDAGLGQAEGGERPGRPRADDGHPGQRAPGRPAQRRLLRRGLGHPQRQAQVVAQRPALAGVQRPADHRHRAQTGRPTVPGRGRPARRADAGPRRAGRTDRRFERPRLAV